MSDVIFVGLTLLFLALIAKGIDNFWIDLTRSTLYIWIPLSVMDVLFLVSQGAVQTFSPYKTVSLLPPTTDTN